MTDLPRPPLPESGWTRLRAMLERPATPRYRGRELRRWTPPAPPEAPGAPGLPGSTREGATDDSVSDATVRPALSPRFASLAAGASGALTAALIGIALLTLVVWGWRIWSQRSVPAVEQLLPVVTAPPVPTLPPSGSAAADQVSTAPTRILVHVAGAVRSPGVVRLDSAGRVTDAIEAAGGAATNADLDRINLAAPLTDGQHIYVIAVDETAPIIVSPPAAGPRGTGGADDGVVDINTATAAELEALPGVGPATAAAIIDHRDQHGAFFEPSDLLDVPGIGPSKFAAMEAQVVTSGGRAG